MPSLSRHIWIALRQAQGTLQGLVLCFGAHTSGDQNMSEPLAPEDFPGPPGLPVIGNVRAIDMAQPIESLMSLAREYGPIFKLTSPGGISAVVSGVDLVSEICDDARFDKVITAGLSILAE